MFDAQKQQMAQKGGFVAALDQSGGSTPKALRLYGIAEDQYGSEAEMFDLIHAMRSRIVEAPSFTGDKVIGAILFEMTMEREIGGKPSSVYLWENRGVVPFLKIDKGLEEAADGVRMMKPIPGLSTLLPRAKSVGVFGTKMRSVIDAASPSGIAANVAQQFDVAQEVLAEGLIPIIEPEITISISDKSEAEAILQEAILSELEALGDAQVMLKLTLPEVQNHYRPLIEHPNVMRVVALSGGYTRDEANTRLAGNAGMIASFSRALTEGLSADQDEAAFNATLDAAITSIHSASVA